MLKLEDVFTDEELMHEIEVELQQRCADDVEIIDWVEDQIGFDIKINGEWLPGFVRVSYETDLMVYIDLTGRGDNYKYQFDINWCDILPEGVE